MANKKLIGLDSLAKFAKDFNNEIDKKFNAELEIKADKSELFSGDYNDLTNKPCYETSELKLFTNDGDNTGRLIVNKGTTNGRFAKISEDVIDFNSVDQVRLSMAVGDEAYEFTDQLDPSTFTIVENETGSAISLDEYVICTFNDNFTMQMTGTGDPIVTFPEKGLYFAFNVGSGHVWRLDNVYLPVASVKQLDEKFIPDTIARIDDMPEGFSGNYNDLTNKPFYDERVFEDIVIEYDGNTEGRVMCSLPALGIDPGYKVADLTAEQLEQYSTACANGFTLTYLKEDGSTEVVQSTIVYSFMGSNYLYAGSSRGQVFLAVEPFSTEIGHADNYVNEAGVYFKENTGTDPYKVVKLEFQNVSGELKTIDAQFLTNSPGIKVEEGKSYISEYNSQTYVAQNNAEIFNDTRNMATGQCSHAEGAMTEAHGDYSHAEGYSTYAIGDYSHAEGGFAKAIGEYSHAEGNRTLAEGSDSHVEGYSNKAIGYCSHAEGSDNKAIGEVSHAEGYRTIAAGKWQHVQGVYNIEDTENKYAHIVGNGDYMYGGSGPSNAHTLDWDGNAWFAGDVFIKGTSQDDGQKLATEDMVNNAVNNIKIPEGFSGDYNDLTNKPEIPSIEGLASETYVNEAIAGIVDSAPETLDTLNELAQALGDDPNFATTIATEIGTKANKSELFSKDYNELVNKPEIPSIKGLATEEFVNNLNNDIVENINEINTELETKASTKYVNNMLSGLRLVQMTQSEYDALEVKDSNTLYIII